MTEPWNAETLAEIATAQRQAQGLHELTATSLPYSSRSSGAHGDWPLSGFAMLARAAGTMRSVMALAHERRAADAAVLLRALFESVVTFAWVAVEPAVNADAWVRWDRKQRLKADNDLRDRGAPRILDAQVRAQFETFVAGGAVMPHNLADRAAQVDAHWPSHVAAIEADPTSLRSFRGMYRYLYRTESQYAHAAVMSLDALIVGGPAPAPFEVRAVERDPGETNPFTRTPFFYALALLIAEQALALPDIEQRVDAIFSA